MLDFDIPKAMESSKIFRPYFREGLESWASWMTFYKVLSGYPREKFSDEEAELFRECAGFELDELPSEPIREVFLIIGRRAGKSVTASFLAVIHALWGEWEQYLSPGEQAFVFVIATNIQQSKIIKRYISAILDLPHFKGMVKRELSDEIELTNGVTIAIKPASWRSTRGFSVGLLIMEELAFWRFETGSDTQDSEIYTAITPGMKTIKNSLVVGISTPFARQGLLWKKYDKHFGKPGSGVLIWRASTDRMNLTITREELENEYLESAGGELGEAEFSAEFLANFREDIEAFLPEAVIQRAVDKGVFSRPFKEEHKDYYRAFCDPSQGLRKGNDSMTFAIAHSEDTSNLDSDTFEFYGSDVPDTNKNVRYVLDVLMEFQPPFKPDDVISQIASVCREYEIEDIQQDRVSLAWIGNDFLKYDIYVKPCELTKSELYEYLGIAMNKQLVRLLDNERMINQARGLHRFLKSGGRILIDHLPGRHDDCINAAAGALWLAAQVDRDWANQFMIL